MASSEEFFSIDSGEVEAVEKVKNSEDDLQKFIPACKPPERKRPFLFRGTPLALLKHKDVLNKLT